MAHFVHLQQSVSLCHNSVVQQSGPDYGI